MGRRLYFDEGMEGGPFKVDERGAGMAKMRVIMKKHGLELPEIWAEYNKRYLATHGVDLAKLGAEIMKRERGRREISRKKYPTEWEELENYLKEHPEANDTIFFPPGPDEEPDPPLPELDDELFAKATETMMSRVTIKAAFYEEASEIIRSTGDEAPNWVSDSEDLRGVAVSGDSARGWVVWNFRGREPTRLLQTFRRLDGRWYNDNETWDLTYFEPEAVRN